jgi:hypothetical protein
MVALIIAVAQAQDSTLGLLNRITASDKALPTMHQTLTGTWMLELRIPGMPGPLPNLVTFHAEGTAFAAPATGTQSPHQGLWIRVGDRKFLQTMFFSTTTSTGCWTQSPRSASPRSSAKTPGRSAARPEIVILSPAGDEVALIPGFEYTGVRLAIERPANVEDFLRGN